MNKKNFEFIISRTFNALPERVWNVWTLEDQLKKLFGPKGCPIFHNKLDLRVGGVYNYGMRSPDGTRSFGTDEYLKK